MKQLQSIITIILFLVWILPLGTFIKPEKEKLACNGKRAICLCRHLLALQLSKAAKKTFLNNGGQVAKERQGTSSSSPSFMNVFAEHNVNFNRDAFYQDNQIVNSLLVIRPIDHVPRSAFFSQNKSVLV